MVQNLDNVYAQIESLKTDLADLRNTYKGLSKSYTVALGTLSELTLHSSEAAKRAAKSTEQLSAFRERDGVCCVFDHIS